MADRGERAARRAARRNGPVENAAVDIAEVVDNQAVVDNQIDVDSDSSSDNELLEEVVRAPHGITGETTGSDCPVGNGSWIMAQHG